VVDGEFKAADHFTFDLFRGAEDVGVVLGEAADAEQSVHGAAAFVAIDGAEFAEADGQVAVAMGRVGEDQDVQGQFIGLSWYSASSSSIGLNMFSL
jgi:hypothetical protein